MFLFQVLVTIYSQNHSADFVVVVFLLNYAQKKQQKYISVKPQVTVIVRIVSVCFSVVSFNTVFKNDSVNAKQTKTKCTKCSHESIPNNVNTP